MKAIGYCRVSTNHQAQEGVSLDLQKEKIRQYADLKGISLSGIIEDAGRTAKNLKRPGFQKIQKMIEAGNIDTIIIYKLDRMFRNTRDALQVTQTLDEKGIAFHSISEQIDTKSPMGRFFFTLIASIAELESGIKGERIKDAFDHKRRRGERLSGISAPYGFKEQKGMLIPDQTEQQMITTMKALRDQGTTLQGIADHLNRKRITTKTGKWWQPGHVQYVLRTA